MVYKEAMCNKCNGVGKYMYPDTATWRSAPGVLSGRAMTLDLCDKCWGSGDEAKPYTNLRALEEERDKLRARAVSGLNGNTNKERNAPRE